MEDHAEVLAKAIAVLKKNDQKRYISPAGGLYPHQWLWDSCFIAIGLRHLSIERAQTELRSLIRGQWTNGMIPNMIFKDSGMYARDAAIWRSDLSVFAPSNIKTSGITQPPMLAEAIVRIGEKLSTSERRSWYAEMYQPLLAYHTWLFSERDPSASGLITLFHPYETGLDNTPPWIDQLHKHHRPWWAKFIKMVHADNLINLIRRDTRHVTPGQRMENLDALLFYSMIRKLRVKKYDSAKILKRNYMSIEDITFNSIFIRANEHLLHIAELIGESVPDEVADRISLGRKSFEQLWDAPSTQYYSRNWHTKRLIRSPSIGALMPLYSGSISKERAEQLVALLERSDMFATSYLVPSVPVNSPDFESLRYWQGPTWLNTNWLIADGLERYGYKKQAKHIRKQSILMVQNHGFYEYFSPLDGSPAGAKDFSWTAALTIDWLSPK